MPEPLFAAPQVDPFASDNGAAAEVRRQHRSHQVANLPVEHREDDDLPKLGEDESEPPEGSIVLVEGVTGTAYQRHHGDGMWHGTNGRVKTWDALTLFQPRKRQYVLLLHLAPETDAD